MDSLPWTLRIVLVIVVWQLSGPSNYAAATGAAASTSTHGDERFVAFRFEVPAPDGPLALGNADDESGELHPFLKSTATLATDLRCFGWVQQAHQSQKRFVGEARCPRRNAAALMAHLQPSSDATADTEQLLINEDLPSVFVYPHAKIRFHFPRFRVLSEPKYQGRTCFKSPPHACKDDRNRTPQHVGNDANSQASPHNEEL
ncbi:hypothetical protein Gpo141_00006659 [Globisporangium polare]